MGCMNIVIFLLQNEANPDLPTVRGETPLHLAARANQTDIIRILLRNGAQVDARARVRVNPSSINVERNVLSENKNNNEFICAGETNSASYSFQIGQRGHCYVVVGSWRGSRFDYERFIHSSTYCL